MATYTSPAVSGIAPIVYHGERGTVQVASATVTCTAAPTTSDTLQFFYLPANARVLGAVLVPSDMDTSGSPTITLNIGDAGSANRIFAANTGAQTGTASASPAAGALGYLYTSKTLITGTAAANATTGAAGTVTLYVQYVIEDPATT